MSQQVQSLLSPHTPTISIPYPTPVCFQRFPTSSLGNRLWSLPGFCTRDPLLPKQNQVGVSNVPEPEQVKTTQGLSYHIQPILMQKEHWRNAWSIHHHSGGGSWVKTEYDFSPKDAIATFRGPEPTLPMAPPLPLSPPSPPSGGLSGVAPPTQCG